MGRPMVESFSAEGLNIDRSSLSNIVIAQTKYMFTGVMNLRTKTIYLASLGPPEEAKDDHYGTKMPMNQVASLSIPEPTLIVAQPFDPTLLGAVERAIRFFLYLLGFMALMSLIGLVPTVAIFVVVFMRLEGPERWPLVIGYAACLVFAISFVFDWLMSIPWPPTLLGHLFPALKFIPSV